MYYFIIYLKCVSYTGFLMDVIYFIFYNLSKEIITNTSLFLKWIPFYFINLFTYSFEEIIKT